MVVGVIADDANHAIAYLNSVVDGVNVAVVVVDEQGVARTLNILAEEMWGRRHREVPAHRSSSMR